MANLKTARGCQYPLVAEFTFNFDDTMVDVAGATKDFKTVGTSAVVNAIHLPVGAVVLGGEVVTDTAITGSTAYNISVGDAASAVRYLGATDRVAAGRTALVPTGFRTDGADLQVTVAPTVTAATAGKVTVRVEFMIEGRANEVVTN